MPAASRTMLAAVYQGAHTIAVEERSLPETGPDQVLIEVSHCGICGSDLHTLYEDWGVPGSIAGHEYSGVIVEVGSRVAGWQPGDRVVGGPGSGCGACRPCRSGRPNVCTGRPRAGFDSYVGAFAGYKALDADRLYRIPDGLDLRTAALTEPVAVALHGIQKARPEPDDRVLVTGAGPIGILTVAVLHVSGVRRVTVSEPAARRRELAVRLGTASVIEPDQLEVPPMPTDLVASPFHVAFECSGRSEAMEAALANLDVGGTLVLSGTGMRRPRFDPNRIILHELTVTGTVEYTPDDYRAALELLASGRLPTDLLIEPEDQPLGRLEWVLGQLSRGEVAGKVMVVPRA